VRHEDKITSIMLRIEFDAFGRTGFVEVNTDMRLLSNTAQLRRHIDSSIANFLIKNNPLRNPN